MVPKFFDELGLRNSNHTVRAGGPNGWEPDDKPAEISGVETRATTPSSRGAPAR